MFGELLVAIPLLLEPESLLADETRELTRQRNRMLVYVGYRHDLLVQDCEEWHVHVALGDDGDRLGPYNFNIESHN